jgi:hypothetical protein
VEGKKMSTPESPQLRPLEKRVRFAAVLVGAGLLLQVATLLKIHPLAFMAFLMVGCPLIAAGIGLYLYSLAGIRHRI